METTNTTQDEALNNVFKIPTFDNLTVEDDDFIAMKIPTEEDASTLYFPDEYKSKQQKQLPENLPTIICKIGKNIEEAGKYKVGDYIFLRANSMQQCSLVVLDRKKIWLNAYFLPSYNILSRVIYTEEYEKLFKERIDKILAKLAKEEESSKPKNKLIS